MAESKSNLVTFNTIKTILVYSLISYLKERITKAISCVLTSRKNYICFSANVQYDLNEKTVKNIANLLNKKMYFADLFSKKELNGKNLKGKLKNIIRQKLHGINFLQKLAVKTIHQHPEMLFIIFN